MQLTSKGSTQKPCHYVFKSLNKRHIQIIFIHFYSHFCSGFAIIGPLRSSKLRSLSGWGCQNIFEYVCREISGIGCRRDFSIALGRGQVGWARWAGGPGRVLFARRCSSITHCNGTSNTNWYFKYHE
jgi:hypothetical protein